MADERFKRMYGAPVPPFLDPRTAVGRFHRIGWAMVGMTAIAYASLIVGFVIVDAAAFGAAAGMGAEAGSVGGGAEVISLAAYRAMRASKAAAAIAAAAGVLIVIGTPSEANARQVQISNVSAVRVLPVEKFKPYKGTQAASTADDVPGSFLQTQETAQDNFDVGTTVLYDWQPHVIIARISAEY